MTIRTDLFGALLIFSLSIADAHAAKIAPASVPAQALLEKVLNSTPKVAYQGQLTVTQWYGKRARTEDMKVYFKPPDKYRWEFFAPDGSLDRVMVSDGGQERVHLIRSQKMLDGESAANSDAAMSVEKEWWLLFKNYRAVLAGSGKVAGREVRVLEMIPKIPGKSHQKLWIDQETGVILQNKRFLPGGRLAARSLFTHFEARADIPESSFDLAAGSSINVEEQGLGKNSVASSAKSAKEVPRIPSELPAGFILESTATFDVRGMPVRHARYTDGLAVLSLFQTDRPVRLPEKQQASAGRPSISPASIRLSSAGRIKSWKRKRNYYILLGDISADLMERVASALK